MKQITCLLSASNQSWCFSSSCFSSTNLSVILTSVLGSDFFISAHIFSLGAYLVPMFVLSIFDSRCTLRFSELCFWERLILVFNLDLTLVDFLKERGCIIWRAEAIELFIAAALLLRNLTLKLIGVAWTVLVNLITSLLGFLKWFSQNNLNGVAWQPILWHFFDESILIVYLRTMFKS